MPLVITGRPKAKAEEKKRGKVKGVGRKEPSKGRQGGEEVQHGTEP